MAVEKKKRIEVKQFVRDVEAGIHPTSLMAKYGLSPGELQRAIKKLEEKGLLNMSESERSSSGSVDPQQTFFKCPSCGAVHTENFDECPNCGIVLAKMHDQVAPPGRRLKTGRQGEPSLPHYPPPVADLSHKRLFQIVGIVLLLFLIVGAGLVYRWVKSSQNLALARNVQAVMDASNGASKPDYSRLAQMFGNATGATAAVMANRRTPFNEKMHEVYQKLFYLGELQTRMRNARPGMSQGRGAYLQAIDAVGRNKPPLDRELDTVRQGVTDEQRSLADAGEGMEDTADSQNVPHSSSADRAIAAARRTGEQEDSTAAQFAKAEDELRSLCSQVLQMLAAR